MGLTDEEIANKFYPARVAQTEFSKGVIKMIADREGDYDKLPNSFPEYLKILLSWHSDCFNTLAYWSREEDESSNPVLKLQLEKDNFKFMMYGDQRIAKYEKTNPANLELVPIEEALTIFRDREWIEALESRIIEIMRSHDDHIRMLKASREIREFMIRAVADKAELAAMDAKPTT